MIRPFELQDKPLLLELMTEFYHSPAVLHPVPKAYLVRTCLELEQNSPYTKAYMLLQNDQPAGYALLSLTYSSEAGGLVVWLEELYIRESYRGAGLGGEFLQYMERQFPHAARFRLEAEADNAGAMRLYTRNVEEILPYIQMIKEKTENQPF